MKMPISRSEGTYVFTVQYSDRLREAPWVLVIESAITAAQIMRCFWGPTIYDVVNELVIRGIPFKMLIPVKLVQRGPLVNHPAFLLAIFSGLGEREPGFKASVIEYAAYEELRKAYVLTYRHCWSAFTRGGIVWRLCWDDLREDQVYEGPRGLPQNQRLVSYNGAQYYEDFLRPEEEDLIVGMYKVRNCEQMTFPCLLTQSNSFHS